MPLISKRIVLYIHIYSLFFINRQFSLRVKQIPFFASHFWCLKTFLNHPINNVFPIFHVRMLPQGVWTCQKCVGLCSSTQRAQQQTMYTVLVALPVLMPLAQLWPFWHLQRHPTSPCWSGIRSRESYQAIFVIHSVCTIQFVSLNLLL